MTTEFQIEIAKKIVSGGDVTRVFHSCEMLRDGQTGPMFPAYMKGAEMVYLGPDDTKGLFGYIRSNGNYAASAYKVASCARSYDVFIPLRVVFFSDNENRDRNFLITRLSAFTFLSGITLQSVIDDKWRLIREESSLFRENFDGKTFYIAFDILVKKLLLPSECEEESCKTFANPICQI